MESSSSSPESIWYDGGHLPSAVPLGFCLAARSLESLQSRERVGVRAPEIPSTTTVRTKLLLQCSVPSM
eukprot:6206338-Pleurochrysis_carterae.AAC.2